MIDFVDYCYASNGLDFNFRVHRCSCVKNGIVVFLPSAKSDSTKDLYPYYPRHKWQSELLEYCVIYVSYPCDRLISNFSRGSWFFHKDESVLSIIMNYIDNLVEINCERLLVYGSSMGGYAALILGRMLKAKFIIAECPQVNLAKYNPFSTLLNGYLTPAVFHNPLTNVFKYYNEVGFVEGVEVYIYMNYGDILHLNQLFSELSCPLNTSFFMGILPGSLNISLSNLHNGYGHVNFPADIGISKIKHLLR